MGTGKTGAMMPAFLVWQIESLSFFNHVAIGPQTAEQFIALRTIACLQSDSLLTLHNWEAVRNTLIANINHINAHLRDNAKHAHQLTGPVGQARMNHKVASSCRQTMLNKATHEINIDIPPGQWHQN